MKFIYLTVHIYIERVVLQFSNAFLDSAVHIYIQRLIFLYSTVAKLQFLYRQNEVLNPKLCRLLRNSLFQPHFLCVSWYPFVSQKIRKKILVTQNKCILFCIKLISRQHIGAKEFKEINWLPTKERVEPPVVTKFFKYWKGTSPFCVNVLFVPCRNLYKTRSHMALEIPLRKSNLGQKSI